MKKLFIILTIALQVGVPATLIHRYYAIQAYGEEVRLKIRAFDPMDLFVGRYLEFDYAVEESLEETWRSNYVICDADLDRDEWAYVPIVKGEPYATFGVASNTPPEQGASIKLRVRSTWTSEKDDKTELTYCRLEMNNITRYYLDDRYGEDDTFQQIASGSDSIRKLYMQIYRPDEVEDESALPQASVSLKIYNHHAIVTGIYIDGRPIAEVSATLKAAQAQPRNEKDQVKTPLSSLNDQHTTVESTATEGD